ncbi:hypothetical protein TRICI_006654 [Trichomonascus ciferrii]|uniref:Enhancer of translation termination 1 n=1 Tax=Trichomonascus ciferrii TaxID=44093 RepID=A0A642UEX3_9ASCO|nr:hypothetical protein TRICI_006654 [Trichomonascus ciferrii]
MKKGKKTQAPQTSEDFLEAGIEEEDGGDRWISSGDVAKGVRFYQRAYRLYRRCIELGADDVASKQDAIYNICRMEYVVYNKVVKTGVLEEISGQLEDDSEQDGSVIVRDIRNIGKHYEEAIEMLGGIEKCQIDLLYNFGQVTVETGEELEDPAYVEQGVKIFEMVMNRQADQIKEMAGYTVENEEESSNYGPRALSETMVTYLQGLYLLVEDESQSVDRLHAEQDKINQVVQEFHNLQSEYDLDDLRLKEDMQLIETQLRGLEHIKKNDLDGLIAFVREIDSDPEASRALHMIEIDLFLDYIAQNDPEDQLKWKAYSLALTAANNGLKKENSRSDPINQIKLYIIKGDLEWLRLNLKPFPSAVHNAKTLESNAKAMYSSAINHSQNCLNVNWDIQNLGREASVKLNLLNNSYSPLPKDKPILDHMISMNLISPNQINSNDNSP